jgi:hypothetical protein
MYNLHFTATITAHGFLPPPPLPLLQPNFLATVEAELRKERKERKSTPAAEAEAAPALAAAAAAAATPTTNAPANAPANAPVAADACPYEGELEAARLRGLAAIESADGENGWKFWGRKKEIDISLMADDKTGLCFSKGTGFIDAPLDVIRYLFTSIDLRAEWDELFMGGRLVDIYGDVRNVFYSTFKCPFPVSNRCVCMCVCECVCVCVRVCVCVCV